MALETDFLTLYYEDRRRPYRELQSRRTATLCLILRLLAEI